MEQQTQKEAKFGMPQAIVIAGILIAGAILLSKTDWQAQSQNNQNNQVNEIKINLNTKIPEYKIKPEMIDVSYGHLLGKVDAKIKIVEYSDFECPYCKNFHSTMHALVDKYNGGVSWEYRHFPLSIHPKAQKEAEASLCANELGGNVAFWNFTDLIFAVTPANNRLDPSYLPKIAKKIGLNENAFTKCLDSGKYEESVHAQASEWMEKGFGTPSGYIEYSDGTKEDFEGAQKLEYFTAKIDAKLQ